MEHHSAARARDARCVALVGPGRAGTAITLALARRGYTVTAVAGRTVTAPSTSAAAARFDAPAVEVGDAGRGAGVVIIATPDAAISRAAAALAPSLRPGALVLHLSGARGLDVLDALVQRRADVVIGALHPLQTLPSDAERAVTGLTGAWAAIDGSERVIDLATELGLHPFRVADRGRYHAAASVASNHVVALLGQLERLAASAGVPLEAFLPLVQASLDHVTALGPAAALTGPVARGDVDTVRAHLDALPLEERATYRALAREALRLAGRDDPALVALLDEVPA
jgi:predicted short-subunit dehydrogenase-like oxidoreductase (DUF2520 family)